MVFSNILKRKREEKGLTQAEVAERIGTTQQNIASFESGYKVPSLKIVVAAADFFHCSVDEMIGRAVS
jgi:putative transcriptional regulator